MTRTLSKNIGVIEFIAFCLLGIVANTCIHEYFNCCHYFYFLLSILSNFLNVAFVLPDSIVFKLNHVQWLFIATIKWASSRQNLSSECPTKRVSSESPQLQGQARKLKFHL